MATYSSTAWRILRTEELGGFPGGSESGGKESACNAGDLGSIPGLGRSPGEGNGHPFQYSYLENPNGQRSLVGYSPWGHEELDTTEQLHDFRAENLGLNSDSQWLRQVTSLFVGHLPFL
ncbi:hypothetical protein U6U81_12190, partial [Cutibacterium acnes]